MSTYCHGGHVRANDIRQHYLRYGGRGDALIVVPGITSPAATWGFVAERLGATFDTYVLDVRGRGLSQGGGELDYSLDTYAKDVATFAIALGLERYHLLGHSLGARTAARLAHRQGDRLDRLVLADPPLSGPGRRPYVKSLAFYTDAIQEALAGRTSAEVVRRTYPTWTDEQLATRAEWLHTCDLAAITASHRGLQDEEIHADIQATTAPALLLAAGKGGVISDDDVVELRSLRPSLEVLRIAHVGHMMPFDDLDAFVAPVSEFLTRTSTASRVPAA